MTPKKKAKEVKVKNVNKAISGCQSDSESVKSIPCYEKVSGYIIQKHCFSKAINS